MTSQVTCQFKRHQTVNADHSRTIKMWPEDKVMTATKCTLMVVVVVVVVDRGQCHSHALNVIQIQMWTNGSRTSS